MVPLGLGMSLSPLSSSTLISPKPPLLSFSTSVSNFKLLSSPIKSPNKIWLQKKIRRGICRADFSQDAPLAAALGACVLSSLIFPVIDRPDEDDGSAMDSTDARFAVMGIISFIPYFNWLSWVFAWLDTGRRRYAVYSLVYLAPYLRSNLSISPEESWLPITSIVLCIIHIQLEASIRNGDLQGFQLFGDAAKHLSSTSRKRETHLDRHQEREEHMNLPSADQQSRDDIERWGVLRKPADHHEQSNGDWNDDERGEQ